MKNEMGRFGIIPNKVQSLLKVLAFNQNGL